MPPSRRLLRHSRWVVWPVAFVVAGLVVAQGSYSAFSAKVSNAGNSFSVGTVALNDDDAGSALFSLTNLRPGSSGTQCITVTSTGTLPSTVKLYTSGASTTKALASYVNLTITQGSGGSYGSCSGFVAQSSGSSLYAGTLAALTGSATGFATGLGSWAPTGTGTESRTFQFGYVISSGTPDSAQGGTASVGFTWEAQNS